MAETHPHITVGHHGRYGVVAATSHDNHVAEHILRLVGFERLPGSDLHSLTDPTREPLRRGAQAVQSMRATHYSVTSDAAYDLQPHTRLRPSQGPTDGPEKPPIMAVSGVEEAAVASARLLDSGIRADRIIGDDQVRDPEGVPQAIGLTPAPTRASRCMGRVTSSTSSPPQVRVDLAVDAFSSVRDNGRPDLVSTTQQRRVQAATAVSPACKGVSPPRWPAVSVEYRPTPAAPEPKRTR
ncbi:hypothetical protein [Streptomyces sp. NBC_00401]|uniref:hypothetical protein n=1 Tax=Streptomyces sp. NBC_00401 TaxID=2975738 RepID=UPI002250D077|nr:hypothetical protein [Streptomyces sp. NBC_00401]MCX5085655.1 hypothetical protein [Streptomyces sp. NBC_00401]